jgi:RNA-directed DNA polymerase
VAIVATLETPTKLRELQRALYQRAKKEPSFRAYALYDKVYREDVLAHAYALVKANGGAAGPDGQTDSARDGARTRRSTRSRRRSSRGCAG